MIFRSMAAAMSRAGTTTFVSKFKPAVLAALAAAGLASEPAAARTIDLWHRPGGFTHQHISQANQWLASGTRLVIRDWQVSAAAIQVVYFKRRGGKVCYAASGFNADPALYFHLSQSQGKHRNDLAHYIGASNAAKVGQLGSRSFKRLHPSVFGIRACSGTTAAEKKIGPRPKIMRW